MKKLLLSISLIFAFFLSFSQQNNNTPNNSTYKSKKHLIGLNAGSSSGIGFSYKYVNKRWGIQASGIPIFDNSLQFASFGLAGTYRVIDPEKNPYNTAFLLYAGTHLLTWRNGISRYETNLIYALGFGFEHKLNDRLELSMMAGYGLYTGDSYLTMIAGEFGLHYRLNNNK